MYWYPKALFTAEQACRRFFVVEQQRTFFQTCPFFTKICISTNIYCICSFLKTLNRRGTQIHSKWRLNFVLSSHIDPIGNQNDVQYLSIFVHILCIFGTRYQVQGTKYIRTYVHTVHTVQYILYILYIPYRTVPYCVHTRTVLRTYPSMFHSKFPSI